MGSGEREGNRLVSVRACICLCSCVCTYRELALHIARRPNDDADGGDADGGDGDDADERDAGVPGGGGDGLTTICLAALAALRNRA